MNRQLTFSGVHGSITRSGTFGDLRLTETSYRPGLFIEAHAHELACFGLVLQGSYQEDFRGKQLLCVPRTVLFRPAEAVHLDRFSESGAHCLLVELSASWLEHLRDFGSLVSDPVAVQDATMERVGNRIYAEWLVGSDDLVPLAIEGLTTELAVALNRWPSCHARTRPPAWLRRVTDLLQERAPEMIRLSEITREVGISRSHLMAEFRRHQRMTIGDFVRHRRIELACGMLLRSDPGLAEIAIACGFPNQTCFSSVFRRFRGMTPGQYRRIMRAGKNPLP